MERNRWLGVELRHLAALEAVGRTRSFGRAARELGYTQSAVSQQIAQLERNVGQRLVDRPGGPRPVDLTDAGRLLLRHADAIVAQLDAAQADLAAFAEGAAGPLRVGIYQSVGARILPGLIRRFKKDWPRVEVSVREEIDAADLLRLLEHGELDLTFADLPLPEGPFESEEVLRDPYVLLVQAGSELAGARARRRFASSAASPSSPGATSASTRPTCAVACRISTSSSAATTTERSSASSPKGSASRSCRSSSSTPQPGVRGTPVRQPHPAAAPRDRVAPRPVPVGGGGVVRRAREELDYRTVQRDGGQYVATTGPMNALRGTEPHVRESHEPSRLSPITKYCFAPSRGHDFVTESRV